MKKMFYSLLFLSIGAHASCYNDYKTQLDLVNTKIEESNIGPVKTQSMITAGSVAVTTTATASGGSAIVSTTVSAQLVGALYLGKLLIDIRLSDNEEALLDSRDQLENAIAILKEIRLENGPFLQQAMPRVWREVNANISLNDLRMTMLRLDDERAYCEAGEINTAAGMLKQAIEVLK